MGIPNDGEFRGETRAQIIVLQRDIARLTDRLDKLQDSIDGLRHDIDKRIDFLEAWRSKVLGIAAALSIFIGGIINFVMDKIFKS